MARRGRRPRVEGQCATARIWAWLTVDERSALQRISEETATPIAVIIRDAVNEYVADASEQRVFSVTGNSRHAIS